jgi:hypothetical protein
VAQWSDFLATDPEVRVQFPALPDFLRSVGSGKGYTQPHEYKREATSKNSRSYGLENRECDHKDSSH